MTLTESSGRLTRWRLRLAEFDFTIEYRPGRVHQVPDALSRLVAPNRGNQSEIDDEVPTFDGDASLLTTVQDVSNELTDHRCTPKCDHNTETVFVTTCAGAISTNEAPGDATEPVVWPHEDDESDELDDVDPDVFGSYEGREVLSNNLPNDTLPGPLSFEELAEEQRADDFCQTVLSRQDRKRDSNFFEDTDGLLKRKHPFERDIVQIVFPKTLRARLLSLTHDPVVAGHPGQNRMYYILRRMYYWPHMAVDVAATVRNCLHCAKNRVRSRKTLNRLKLFPATAPLESIGIDILGPLPKSKKGRKYLLVITDRFTKLKQVVALRSVTAYVVAVAFCEACVFKYGVPKTLLSDNGPQFSARFFRSVCEVLGVTNLYTSAYHPKTNGQTERYNRTIVAMLQNYVNEHQNDWDVYVGALTYAYNCHVHRSTRTTPFDLVLTRPPPEFSLHHSARRRSTPDANARDDFRQRLDLSIQKAYKSLQRTQARYKRDFDKRVRRVKSRIRAGDFIFLDSTDGATKPGKLQSPAEGPYKVLRQDKRTLTIDRNGVTECVSADRCVFSPPPIRARTNAAEPATGPTTENSNAEAHPRALNEVPLASTADFAQKVHEGPTYTVDRLLDHRTRDGNAEFLVKWTGYADPTCHMD